MQQRLVVVSWVLASALAVGCASDSNKSGGNTPAPSGAAGFTGAAGTLGAPSGAAGSVASTGGDPACMSAFTAQGQSADCAACACTMCAAEVSALSVSAEFQQKAQAVVDCGRANCCAGTACYCGTDLAGCVTGTPSGPCVAQIEAAAGAMGAAGVTGPCADSTNACGAASALGLCLTGDPATMVVGKCPACAPTCM